MITYFSKLLGLGGAELVAKKICWITRQSVGAELNGAVVARRQINKTALFFNAGYS